MLLLNEHECPFCGGQALRRYRATAYDDARRLVSIVECRSCQAAWQWPIQRTESQSAQVFGQSYAEREEGTYFDPAMRESVADCQREFIEARVRTPGRLLDLGCGDGTFARNMARAGWDVLGLDPALHAAVAERFSSGHLRLRSERAAEMPPEEVFDVVTLWDVVEHVEKPDQLIFEAAARLAPGGTLLVETGNYQSAGRVVSDRKWWNYQVDHRWYFAPPQLRAILADAGLQHVELAERVLRPWWKGRREMPPVRLRTLVKNVARRPWRSLEAWRCHRELIRGSRRWETWGGLEIMVMTGRK